MKRRTFIQSISAASLLSGCAGGAKLPDSRSIVDTPEKRAEYTKRILRELCTGLGPHPCGSPEYDMAADIVRREMLRALPSVEYDTLVYDYWVLLNEAEFYIGDRKMETFLAHGAGGTPPGGIRGVLRASDLQNTPYAVIDPSTGEILARVAIAEAWAVAGLAVSRPWYRYYEEPGGLPVFNLGKPDIPFLDESVKNDAPVRMNAQVEFIPGTETSNVVGTLPGESTDEIIVYAHLDTVYNSEGANDNTGSVAMMLMLAHALSGRRHSKTLTFIATTGEEYNYLGTNHYAARRKEEGTLDTIRFIMNFDSVTWGPDMRLITLDEDVVDQLTAIDERLNLDGAPTWTKSDGLGRETIPFKEAGVNARGLVVDSGGYDHNHVWHRPSDTVETVPVECAEICFRLFNEFILELLGE